MGLYGNRAASSNGGASFYPVLSLLIGASMWGLIWYPMRLLEGAGLAGLYLTVVLYAAAFFVTLPRTAPALKAFVPLHADLLVLALAAGWTNTAFVLAVLDGNILRVLLLFYLAPLWTVILGWLVLREHPSRASLAILVLAMAGAVAMLWNPKTGVPWPREAADWYAISSGFAFAVSNVFVRKMHVHIPLAAKSIAVWLGSSLVAGSLIVLSQVPIPQAAASVWLSATLLGVLAITGMTLLVQYGVTHMPVHRSAVIMLFELVVGAISQQLLTDETMTAIEWAGGAFIVLAAYLSAKH